MTGSGVDRELELLVSDEADGMRLDVFLASQSDEFSRSFLQKLIKEGAVSISGGDKRLKASMPVREGDVLRLRVPEAVLPELMPQDIPLDILYETAISLW